MLWRLCYLKKTEMWCIVNKLHFCTDEIPGGILISAAVVIPDWFLYLKKFRHTIKQDCK